MPTNWAAATAANRPPSAFQPLPSLRLILPPKRTTRNPARVANSATTAKFIRKPVVRHMEQKERSSAQRDSSGKGTHLLPVHRLCSPMVSVTVPPEGEGMVTETHLGEAIEAIVMAVAVSREEVNRSALVLALRELIPI